MVWLIYIAVVNLIALFLMSWDKHAAAMGKRRIPERRLFFISALGGSIGVWIMMYALRHKTLNKSFVIGIPLMFFIQIGFVAYLLYLNYFKNINVFL